MHKYFLFFLLLVGVVAYHNAKREVDLPALGETHEEELVTTIPPDVLSYVKNQNNVLGWSDTLERLIPLPKSVRVPILMYHYIEYVKDAGDTIRKSLNTTPYTLEQQIKTLLSDGYTFLTNADLAHILDGNMPLPDKPVVLTFDDGYRDFYTDAYPILKKYNVKATQYVVSGFLNRPNYMFTKQLKEIAHDGLVEIGAHTVSHTWLKGLAIKRVQKETEESKTYLEELIGTPVISFAYPYGAFDVQAISAVYGAGFRSATSTVPGVDQLQNQRYFLYRLRPGGRTGQQLLTWLASVKN